MALKGGTINIFAVKCQQDVIIRVALYSTDPYKEVSLGSGPQYNDSLRKHKQADLPR